MLNSRTSFFGEHRGRSARNGCFFLRRLIGLVVVLLFSGLTARAAEPLSISYQLAKSQPVSINIYNSSGSIVRELLHCAARSAGAQTETWDGRDGEGNALPAGTYTWKMLSVPGFGAEFITTLGTNYTVPKESPFWAQAPGCHAGVLAVAADKDGFYASAGTENIETALFKQSLDGTKRFWSNTTPDAWAGIRALTVLDDHLWALTGPKVYRYNKDTGIRKEDLTGVSGQEVIASDYQTEPASDMAVDEKSVVLTYPVAGLVRWLDYSGKETQKLALPKASSVNIGPDGTVYIIADKTIVKVRPGQQMPEVFLSNVADPLRITTNPGNGDVYLLQGAPTNQVQRYSAEGKLLQTYGKPGGRVDGPYQSQRESFRGATDIAVMPDGKFWVTEGNAAPRRTAEFAPDGSVIKEWYGGQLWGPWIAPEPDNPQYVWMASAWGDMMRLKVNYAKKTWEVNACFTYGGMANGMVPAHGNGEIWDTAVHAGTLYICKINGGGAPIVLKVDREKLKVTPVVVGIGDLGHDPWSFPKWLTDKATSLGDKSVLWTDANGDGSPLNADGSLQESELSFFKNSGPDPVNPHVDGNLNYTCTGGTLRYSVSSWNKEGAPIYGSFPQGETGVSMPPRLVVPGQGLDDRWSQYVCTDSAGNIWGAFNPGITGWGSSKDSFLARWNPDGKLAWEVGHSGSAPGQFRAFRHIFGIMKSDSGDRCIVAGAFSYEWVGEGVTPIYVYDEDGLYAGQLIGQPIHQGNTPNTKYGLGAEALSGSILRDKDGDVYFYSHWINEGRVYKITGWNDWQREKGTVEIPANYTAPDFVPEVVGPTGTGKGLRGSYFTSADCSGSPTMIRIDSKMDVPASAIGNYSVRWEGTLTPRRTGWHMFDQARGWQSPNAIWVNGVNVQDRDMNSTGWPLGAHRGPSRVIWLEAGKAYPFRVDYPRNYPVPSASDGILLQWAEPETNGNLTTIPDGQFSPAPL